MPFPTPPLPLRRAWNSPTLTTWGSYAVRSLELVLVTPLILTQLGTADIALWYLFVMILGLQLLADLGFGPTFTRVLAFAMGGTAPDDLADLRRAERPAPSGTPDWQTAEQIWATMRVIYTRLTALAVLLLGTLGTWAVARPIAETADPGSAWMAWGVLLLGSTVALRGTAYGVYLQGVNRIALLRRWEALTGLGSVATSLAVLLLGGGLLGLVLAHQAWMGLTILRNRWLCRAIDGGRFRTFRDRTVHAAVFEAVWPSAWRSGVGIAMSYGLVKLSGVLFAQLGAPGAVATYLLALQLTEMLSRFSQAPFYSKLPLLARLRAEGRQTAQIDLARRGMQLSYWTFVLGFIGLGLFGAPLLDRIGSNVAFADPLLWTLLGLGLVVERYGAMHIQLYSTTNHIIWHVANGVTGTLYLLVSLLLFPVLGVYAFPVGLLAGYLGFYSWYSARHSYRTFGLRFWSFERRTLLHPLAVLLLYAAGALAAYLT
ncbi:MAG: hypothetical protein R3247_11740 [Rhodothermales bacterium]|nr:hypothetical protein [Rhodothermales bacterium]